MSSFSPMGRASVLILSRGTVWAALVALVFSVACRPQPPDLQRLPRLEVPFDGVTDGSNATATPVPETPPARAPQPAPVVMDQPDPPARPYQDFIRYEIQFSRGDVSVLSANSVHLERPTEPTRMMGRFAFELYVGVELLERTRFDFPLLGAAAQNEDDPIEAGLQSRIEVLVPAVERATWAQILDRKTRKTYAVSWPPSTSAASQVQPAD